MNPPENLNVGELKLANARSAHVMLLTHIVSRGYAGRNLDFEGIAVVRRVVGGVVGGALTLIR